MTTPMTPTAKLEELREILATQKFIEEADAMALIDVAEAACERVNLLNVLLALYRTKMPMKPRVLDSLNENERKLDAALARLGGGR